MQLLGNQWSNQQRNRGKNVPLFKNYRVLPEKYSLQTELLQQVTPSKNAKTIGVPTDYRATNSGERKFKSSASLIPKDFKSI
jgi:hypothetical protein